RFEEQIRCQPDAEQHDQRQRVDVQGIQSQDPVDDARTLHQSRHVEQHGQREDAHAQKDYVLEHSKISSSGVSERLLTCAISTSRSGTSSPCSSSVLWSELRPAETMREASVTMQASTDETNSSSIYTGTSTNAGFSRDLGPSTSLTTCRLATTMS